MTKIYPEYFPSWPYDDGLCWLNNKHEEVLRDPGKIFIACGSHQEQVITLGRDAKKNNLLKLKPEILIRQIDRGGGATAHEPGQIVLYPVLNLRNWNLTPVSLVNLLKYSMSNFLNNLGFTCEYDLYGPGVYVSGYKIGFIGIRIKNKISQHGLAINIFNNCEIFSSFDPCGYKNLNITSVNQLINLKLSLQEVMSELVKYFTRGLLQGFEIDSVLKNS